VNGRIAPVSTRVIRFFSYFTVESNVLVAVGTAALALRPYRDGRVWRVVRLASLLGIAVTFVTYAVLLAPIVKLTGVSRLTDIALHYVVPLMAIGGWLVFGPWPRIDERTLLLSMIWPAAFVCYTLAHGAATGWYPYPFVDVTRLGYVTTLRNGLGLVVLMVGVGALYRYGDHRLPGKAAGMRPAPVIGEPAGTQSTPELPSGPAAPLG
jgi:hypothetical protein